MSAELDLTFLTPEEIEQIRGVLNRAKETEENLNGKSGSKELISPEIFQASWKENHGITDESYRTGREVVAEALNIHRKEQQIEENIIEEKEVVLESESKEEYTEQVKLEDITEQDPPDIKEEPEPVQQDTEDGPEEESVPQDKEEVEEPSSEEKLASIEETTPETPENEEVNGSKESDTSEDSKKSEDESKRKVTFQPPIILLDDKEIIQDDGKDKDRLSPLRGVKTAPESPSKSDTKSMVSRTSLHHNDYVGELEVSLTYYTSDKVKQNTFPSTGTRFSNNNQLDVLTRKTYAALSGAKIPIMKDRKSGAKEEDDGEMHLLVSGAFELQLPTVMKKKAKTYIKCYLLPDRYHGSKMRSEVIKDSLSPKFNHTFVFRGFSEADLKARAIEVVVGGVASTHGRHIVVGGIRLSDGHQDANRSSLKDSNDAEISLWNSAFEKPCSKVTGTLPLRPNIKLTYQ